MLQQLEVSTGLLVRECAGKSQTRLEFWTEIVRRIQGRTVLEIGVYQADFAVALLRACESVDCYYMLDPWRHLSNWNKPANEEDSVFNHLYESAMEKTAFAANRRVVLRGTTSEMIDKIPDASLDFAYIDGDHTLRGITIDLIRVYSKVKTGGFIGGDDFTPTIWQHHSSFEPSLVYPWVVHFAEAVGATIYGLPNSQFFMQKTTGGSFDFVDLTGKYSDPGLRNQVLPEKSLSVWFTERYPRLARIARKIRRIVNS